jgi:predicted phosphoribosyltransferase
MVFEDRQDAGRQLASCLQFLRAHPNTIVLALPRGGVPVGYEVAAALNLSLDIFLVRKLGTPGQEELALGALTSDGTTVFNADVIRDLYISQSAIDQVIAREKLELQRREEQYRAGEPPLPLQGQTIILVDDGLATGASMRAAVRALRPIVHRIIVAAPVAAFSTCNDLRQEGVEVIALDSPAHFGAVGAFYHDFSQTTDDEVRTLLARSRQRSPESLEHKQIK